jgi:hypothetical protein
VNERRLETPEIAAKSTISTMFAESAEQLGPATAHTGSQERHDASQQQSDGAWLRLRSRGRLGEYEK